MFPLSLTLQGMFPIPNPQEGGAVGKQSIGKLTLVEQL